MAEDDDDGETKAAPEKTNTEKPRKTEQLQEIIREYVTSKKARTFDTFQ